MIKRHSKYIFPTFEKAVEMKDSLTPTEEEPNNHSVFGLKREKLTEQVVDEKGETIEEATYSERYQLDVVWSNLPNEGTIDEPIYDHPYGWKKYAVDLSHEGNTVVAGMSYFKRKLC